MHVGAWGMCAQVGSIRGMLHAVATGVREGAKLRDRTQMYDMYRTQMLHDPLDGALSEF